jgi:hypothetical protein
LFVTRRARFSAHTATAIAPAATANAIAARSHVNQQSLDLEATPRPIPTPNTMISTRFGDAGAMIVTTVRSIERDQPPAAC